MEKQVMIKRRRRRKKVCNFCVDSIDTVDYKNTDRLRRYITDRGKIVPKRNSGVCAKHQRVIAMAVKRARHIGLVPYSVE